jgi:hypothetical protein
VLETSSIENTRPPLIPGNNQRIIHIVNNIGSLL